MEEGAPVAGRPSCITSSSPRPSSSCRSLLLGCLLRRFGLRALADVRGVRALVGLDVLERAVGCAHRVELGALRAAQRRATDRLLLRCLLLCCHVCFQVLVGCCKVSQSGQSVRNLTATRAEVNVRMVHRKAAGRWPARATRSTVRAARLLDSRQRSPGPAPLNKLPELFANNRRWAAATEQAPSGVLRRAFGAAVAALPLDRLLRQPRTRQRDRGSRAGRAVRAPQRREPGVPQRFQLSLGAAVRHRRARHRARHRLRPLRLRRRDRGVASSGRSGWSTTGCCRSATSPGCTRRSWRCCRPTCERADRLCELNVLFQARRVCRTTIVQQAWERGIR